MTALGATRLDERARDEDELSRLASLYERDILGSAPEAPYDGIVRAAAAIADVPVAFINFVDADRLWCKAGVGLDFREAPRESTFCSTAIRTPGRVMVVRDASLDPRFADFPVVAGPPNIRFYAGFVLADRAGRGLGTLCVLDQRPRELDAEQIEALRDLAAAAQELVEQRVLITDVERRRQASELFEVGFENTSVGMQLLDGDGQYLRVNQAFADMIGLSPHEIVGRNWRDLTHADDQRPSSAIAAQLRSGQIPAHRELKRYVRPDGTVVWGLVNVVPVRVDPDVDERLHFTQVIDVTDAVEARRRAELLAERLADEERRFRLALEQAPTGVAVMSPDGRFVDVNAALCRLTGYERADLLRASLSDITHPEDRPALDALIGGRRAGGAASRRRELRLWRSDETTVDALVAVSTVDGDTAGEPYLIGQIVDIGERKQIEQAQQSAIEQQRVILRRLIELDQIKSNLISNVSHELRTPLTSILGYLELLRDDDETLNAQQERLLGIAARNGERLLQVVENLLASSALRNQLVQPEFTSVPVQGLVDSIVATMMPMAEHSDVRLRVSVSPDVDVVDADPALLERVLMNLASNAVKFTPAGGSVTIAATIDGDRLCLRVTDTGIGIPAVEQENLFTRFFRSTAANEQAIPGTGLGLSITAELVHAHDGQIEVDSVEGTGTTVRVFLPLRRSGGIADMAAGSVPC